MHFSSLPACIISHIRPITYLILRARDVDLIDFFQNAPIAFHWLNEAGIVLWANQTELKILGYAAEEFIGKPITTFVHPDDKELVSEIFKQLRAGNSVAEVPVRYLTKNGRIVHLLIDSNITYNKDGSFGHTRCIIRDDSARKIRDVRTKLLIEETKKVRFQFDQNDNECCNALPSYSALSIRA
jgi:two-component system sensor histidine kinase VicK